jgi:hypothetical protein
MWRYVRTTRFTEITADRTAVAVHFPNQRGEEMVMRVLIAILIKLLAIEIQTDKN